MSTTMPTPRVRKVRQQLSAGPRDPRQLIRLLRRLKFTNALIGRAAGVTEDTVAAWSTGRTVPPETTESKLELLRLAVVEMLRHQVFRDSPLSIRAFMVGYPPRFQRGGEPGSRTPLDAIGEGELSEVIAAIDDFVKAVSKDISDTQEHEIVSP